MTAFVGIDNGVSGAIAIVGQCGSLLAWTPMPVSKHRSRNEINIRQVHLWLSEKLGGNLSNASYLIEEPNNSRTPSTAYSVASSFHSLRGFFETKMLFWDRITPQKWQKAILGKVPTGMTKEYALGTARAIWPEEPWLVSKRCSKPHDGAVDAALIALYAQRLDR